MKTSLWLLSLFVGEFFFTGVVRSIAMPAVVDTQKMGDEKVPSVFLRKLVIEVEQDSVIHRVQILDVEGRKREAGVEQARKARLPGVIPHEGDLLSLCAELRNHIVLLNRGARKIAASINERGEPAGGESLQTLQRRRWRISLPHMHTSNPLKTRRTWQQEGDKEGP